MQVLLNTTYGATKRSEFPEKERDLSDWGKTVVIILEINVRQHSRWVSLRYAEVLKAKLESNCVTPHKAPSSRYMNKLEYRRLFFL